ncbi:core-2/I-Branching enzyme family protein [Aphelenchoides avenae]|nr:core-2/I-Branching enzyme family protein [Aphelenchus avenae]
MTPKKTMIAPPFKRPTGTESLDCSRIISGDSEYIKTAAGSRIVLSDKDDMHLPMDCASIRSRNYFPTTPMSKDEAKFPIAFARIVYTDYRFLEMEFASEYAPQNVFCFAIDSKSSKVFRERIRSLAKCFPNVVVTKQEYSVESSGRNMWFPYLECFTELLNHYQRWTYVVTLQV